MKSTVDDLDAVRRLRLAAQRLHRPRTRTVADLVGDLLAVQAQDIGAAPLALRARSRTLTASAVAAARSETSVVRTWGPRGTLHLVAASDLPWLVALTGPTMRTAALRRLGQEGVTGTPGDLVRAVGRTLAGAGPLTKVEFGERLAATTGVVAHGQGLVHLVGLAAAAGTVVLGPDRGTKPTYVHAAEWLGREITLETDRERALAELARRYLRAHAPAAPTDLAAWSGLSLRDARTGWDLIAADLVAVGELWTLRRGQPAPADAALALLPAFDELLMGWRERSIVLDPADAPRVLRGGMVSPVLLIDGRVGGVWRAGEVSPFGELTAAQQRALGAEQADLERFRTG